MLTCQPFPTFYRRSSAAFSIQYLILNTSTSVAHPVGLSLSPDSGAYKLSRLAAITGQLRPTVAMSVYADPAPRPRTFNPLRSLVSAVRSPFSPKSSNRTRTLSTNHVVNRRPISSPYPDEDTQAIGNRVGIDLDTAQRSFKFRSTPSLPNIPSSPTSTSTFVSTSGSSTPFDAVSESSVSLYSQSSSATRPQPRLDYRTLAPSNTPVIKSRTASRPLPSYTPARPLRAPVPVSPVLRQQQVQLLHPYSIPPQSPRPPSYSRPTPAAYPDLVAPRTRHRSLPSLDRSTVPPKPAPPPNTPLPPLPTNVPPRPRPQRSTARPSTAGNERRPPLRPTVSTDGDIFTLRQNAAASSASPRPHRTRQYAGSSSTLYF